MAGKRPSSLFNIGQSGCVHSEEMLMWFIDFMPSDMIGIWFAYWLAKQASHTWMGFELTTQKFVTNGTSSSAM